MDLHAEMKYGHGQNTNLPIGILNNNPSTFGKFPARYCFPEQVPSILHVPGFHRRGSKLHGPGPVKAAAGCPRGGSSASYTWVLLLCRQGGSTTPTHTTHPKITRGAKRAVTWQSGFAEKWDDSRG